MVERKTDSHIKFVKNIVKHNISILANVIYFNQVDSCIFERKGGTSK